MTRRLAAFLTCALMAFGQRSRTPESPARPSTRFVDAVVLDAAGRPVADLTPADFEVVQSGHSRKITQFTWFDARLHTARTPAIAPGDEIESLDLVPDEIHRNFIAIVDDLGLPAAGIAAVQRDLRKFITEQMGTAERMAVLRTSVGTGDLQQLTADRRILATAIDRIQFLGGQIPENTAAGACWLSLRYALEGLRHIPGRKFVVLFSQNLQGALVRDMAAKDLSSDAHAAMATVYAVDPRGPVAPDAASKAPPQLGALVRDTGGTFGTDLALVLQAEEGFYALGFEEANAEFAVRARDEPVTLKVLRPGVTLRARAGYVHVEPRRDFAAPVERSVQILRALASPYEAAGIHTRLTATFVTFDGRSAAVEVAVLVDARDLAVIRDAKNTWRGSLRMILEAHSDQAARVPPIERVYDMVMTPEEYQHALRDSLLYTVALRLPSPGAWQFRAVVADEISDRLGAAVQNVQIPAPNQFAISGLKLRAYDPARGKEPHADANGISAVRAFKVGQTVEYICNIFDALADDQKQSRLEVRSRLYALGSAVYSGAPSQLGYLTQAGEGRQISGRLTLSAEVIPGDYILEVTVTDKLAPPGAPRIVSSVVDFQLRH